MMWWAVTLMSAFLTLNFSISCSSFHQVFSCTKCKNNEHGRLYFCCEKCAFGGWIELFGLGKFCYTRTCKRQQNQRKDSTSELVLALFAITSSSRQALWFRTQLWAVSIDFQKRCKSSSVWFSSCILEDTQVFAKQIWDGLALSWIFSWSWKIVFHDYHLILSGLSGVHI